MTSPLGSLSVPSSFAFATLSGIWLRCAWIRGQRRRKRSAASVVVALVDNGSLKPRSTLALRSVAAKLQEHFHQRSNDLGFDLRVEPVSARWSAKVDPETLGGVPGRLFADLARDVAKEHNNGANVRLVALPYFIGPSKTVTEFLHKASRIALGKSNLRVAFAPVLVSPNPLHQSNDGLSKILASNVLKTAHQNGISQEKLKVVVVDHGSPTRAVCDVRNLLGIQVKRILAAEGVAAIVVAASMERREGEKYAFAEPLLERVLAENIQGCGEGDVIVAMAFLSPGRHAGPGGDVDEIIEQAVRRANDSGRSLQVTKTGLLGAHPDIVEVLSQKLRDVLPQVL